MSEFPSDPDDPLGHHPPEPSTTPDDGGWSALHDAFAAMAEAENPLYGAIAEREHRRRVLRRGDPDHQALAEQLAGDLSMMSGLTLVDPLVALDAKAAFVGELVSMYRADPTALAITIVPLFGRIRGLSSNGTENLGKGESPANPRFFSNRLSGVYQNDTNA